MPPFLNPSPQPKPTRSPENARQVKSRHGKQLPATPEMKLTVSAVNGASPNGASEIVVRFDATEDAENAIAGRYMVIDPDSAESGTVTDSAYTDVYDAAFPARKFTAERPPIQDLLPGSTRMAMRFDGAQVMIGPRTSDFVTPGTDEDLTLAMAVHVAPSDRKDVGWCIVINKGDTQPGIGVGYDYAASQFVFAYANSFNGAVQMGRTTERFETGVSRVVRLRKVGESLRLYIDGKLAAEETGKGVRKVILAANEGAPMGLGGMFRPAPSLVGSMGKIYIVKGILTTREESHIDNDLADWAQVSIKSN